MPPEVAVDGGPRCDYVVGIGQQCEMTPHGPAYPHRLTALPVVIDNE